MFIGSKYGSIKTKRAKEYLTTTPGCSSTKKKRQLRTYRVSPDSKRKLDKLLGQSPLDSKRNLKSIKEEVKTITEKLKLLSYKDCQAIRIEENLSGGKMTLVAQKTLRSERIVLSPEKVYGAKPGRAKHTRNKSTVVYNKGSDRGGFYLKNSHKRSISKDCRWANNFKSVKQPGLDMTNIRKFVVSDNFDSTCKHLNAPRFHSKIF